MTDSDLYLRYVIGQVDPETLHTSPERHLCCNPTLSQYIVDDRFKKVLCEGDFAKRNLDPDHVKLQEELITRGWRRLRELVKLDLPITEYPLPEVIERLRGETAD